MVLLARSIIIYFEYSLALHIPTLCILVRLHRNFYMNTRKFRFVKYLGHKIGFEKKWYEYELGLFLELANFQQYYTAKL
jgi:hypothetical protein